MQMQLYYPSVLIARFSPRPVLEQTIGYLLRFNDGKYHYSKYCTTRLVSRPKEEPDTNDDPLAVSTSPAPVLPVVGFRQLTEKPKIDPSIGFVSDYFSWLLKITQETVEPI